MNKLDSIIIVLKKKTSINHSIVDLSHRLIVLALYKIYLDNAMTISLLNQITDQFFYMSLMIFIQALKIQTHVMVSHKKGRSKREGKREDN